MSVKKNILITIKFDGSNYSGWQIQKNAFTVQEAFQNSLKRLIKSDKFEIKGCSRTDAGVHANIYCISLKINFEIPFKNLVYSLNDYLPADISVLNAQEVPENFHARYSSIAKEYIYKLYFDRIKDPFLATRVYYYPYYLDETLLKKAAEMFVGIHDFSAFCSVDKRYSKVNEFNFIRKIFYFEIKKEFKILEFKIKADGFLYNMVRIMVGTLLMIQRKSLSPDVISEIIKSKKRENAGPTVPARGLYLNKVFYDNNRLLS